MKKYGYFFDHSKGAQNWTEQVFRNFPVKRIMMVVHQFGVGIDHQENKQTIEEYSG